MPWQPTPYTAWTLLSSVVSAALAAFAARNHHRSGAVPLAALLAGAAVWTLGNAFQLASADLAGKVFWANVQYVGIVVVPTALLFFVLEYTGHGGWVTRRTVALFAIEPVLVVVLAWTNPGHHLFRGSATLESAGAFVVLETSQGIVFWLHVVYSYALIALATALVVRLYLTADHLYRSQAAAILVGVFVPWIGNALFLAGVTPPGVHPTPLAFIVTGIALTWAVFRYDLLDVIPVTREIARKELIESMPDAVVIVDERRRIADLNPASRPLLDRDVSEAIGEPVGEVIPELSGVLGEGEGSMTDRGRIEFDRDGTTRYYDARVSSLSTGVALGHLIILRDVTDRERYRQRLEVLNRVLRHDLRNDMNVMTALAEDIIERAPGEDSTVVRRARRIEEKGLELAELSEKARDLQRAMDREEIVLELVDIADVVREQAAGVAESFPDAEVETDVPEEAYVYASGLIDSAVRNVVQNAVEHNDNAAPEVTVAVGAGREDGFVEVAIADDGPGLPEEEREVLRQGAETPLRHSSGLGLWLVSWIVTESGGRIEFEDNEPRGTVIRIELLAAEPEAARERLGGRPT